MQIICVAKALVIACVLLGARSAGAARPHGGAVHAVIAAAEGAPQASARSDKAPWGSWLWKALFESEPCRVGELGDGEVPVC